jgi:acetyl-CoA acyltransferase 1
MSKNWGAPIDTTQLNMDALGHEMASGCYHSMLQTSDEVSSRFSMDRQKCDEVAVESHRKAQAAISSGRFRDEIVPITATYTDAEGDEKTVTLSDDEGVRVGTTMEALARLKPALGEGGVTTAGNASQVSDGAAIVLVATRRAAQRYSLPIIGRLVSQAVVGVEPAIMGVGPAAAIPAAIERASLSLRDIQLFEINEAFASQYRYSIEHLGIDPSLVNVNGGAIAIGHPLGCTGARMTCTLLHELAKRNERIGCVSMCIGSGMGMAALFERL